jgi:O-phosphoseryl-tRNA(Cys) synthetase
MSVNPDIEKLIAGILDQMKPELKQDPKMAKVVSLSSHLVANIFIDLKRIADALEQLVEVSKEKNKIVKQIANRD